MRILTIYLQYRLLIIFASSLCPDQSRQNVGPDLDPNCLTLTIFLKVDFEKNQQTTKKHALFPSRQRVKYTTLLHSEKI